MEIQWFPGHMHAARKQAAETLAHADVVVEVVDARLPAASSNPLIEELRTARQRPAVRLLNKADLADPEITKAWLPALSNRRDTLAKAFSARKPADVAKLLDWCRQLAPHRGTPLKPLRIMIMGIPNVGKSTLMNALLKKRVAAVGDEPAVTKSQQRLDLDVSTQIIDTPGLMWPKIAYPSDGWMLAASHAIGRNALHEDEVACFLGTVLLSRYPHLLEARYKASVANLDGPALLELVAQKRALRARGGAWDIEKAALLLLQEYRDGALGRISLETPTTRAAMCAAHTSVETPHDPA